MGPNLLYDKSTFQALSSTEHDIARDFFLIGIQPLLADEILADLSKVRLEPRRSGETDVVNLARRFFGSGPPVLVDHFTAISESLHGNEPPQTGQFVMPDGPHITSMTVDGGLGFAVDLQPVNHALLNWQEGRFTEAERLRAKFWRSTTTGLTHYSFRKSLDEARVLLPRVTSPDAAFRVVADEMKRLVMQDIYLGWLLRSLPSSPRRDRAAKGRLHRYRYLIDSAPYATFCLGLMLFFEVLTRNKLLHWKPTNAVDLRHLFYLPFCHAFTSGDRLHKLIAPYFLRSDQAFLPGEQLKADLRSLGTLDKNDPSASRLHQHYMKAPDSIVCESHITAFGSDLSRRPKPPKPLNDVEKAKLLETVRRMKAAMDAKGR